MAVPEARGVGRDAQEELAGRPLRGLCKLNSNQVRRDGGASSAPRTGPLAATKLPLDREAFRRYHL